MKSAASHLLTFCAHVFHTLGALTSQHAEAGKDLRVRENGSSNLTSLVPQFFSSYGSKRTEIRYGPFTIDGMMTNNGMNGTFRWNLKLGI